MNGKCDNKILFYLENKSAVKSIPDEILIETYQLAKQNDLSEGFILVFEKELQKRGILY